MTGVIDREFQKVLVKECINELLQIQNPKPEDLKLFEDVLKKYENRIYERAAHRIPVNTIDDKRIKEDLSLTGPRPGFGIGPGLGTGFGFGPQPGQVNQVNQFGFSPQKNQGLGNPGGFGFPGAFPQFPHAPQEARNFGDPQANSKYYYPQDYPLYQNNPNAPLNKPVNPQYVMPNVGIPADPLTAPNFLGQNQFLDPRFQPGGNPAFTLPQNPLGAFPRPNEIPFQNFGQAGPGLGFPNAPNLPGGFPQGQFGQFGPFGDEQFRLKRNVELIGGIERTLPNMERSLRDYEFKNLENSLRSPPKRNNPGLTGTNPYDLYNQYNQYNQNQNQYNQFGQSLQNPVNMAGLYSPPPRYDATSIRGASPARGTTPGQNLSHRSFTSPDRGGAPEYEQRQNNFMRNQYPQSEDRLRKEHKASLSFSKELRQQKLEGFGVKFNLRQEDDY